MIRKKKLYNRPRKAYESSRIKEENLIVAKYGLKNKREIWKAAAKIAYFRTRAKELSKSSVEEQEVLFGKLRGIGLKINSVADVLDLRVEDLLNRRLPTILFTKKLASTPKQARQLVVHKKILVDGNTVNAPSYLVPLALENKLSIKVKHKKPVEKKESEKAPEVEIKGEEQ